MDTSLKPTATHHPSRHALAFGPFKLLRTERLLLEDGVPVRLGSRALDLLIALAERAGDVVSREELEACVWPMTVVEETSLRVHVSALRKALGDGHGGARYIINQPGRGYCFVAPVSRVPHSSDVPHGAPARVSSTLPVRLTRIIGRDEVVAKAAAQLASRRFVTLVGPGGIGKTTLALAIAECCAVRYDHGVVFIDLATVADDRLVPAAAAYSLGMSTPAGDVVASLSSFLHDKALLVVLDSCEHVVEGVVALVEQLLKSTPGLAVLATSREPLRAEGEWLHRVPGLRMPAEGEAVTASQALEYPAVQLFVERAMTTADSFALSDDDAPVVAELCRRLDGNALAIELAAARVGLFGVRGLARQLDAHILQLKGQRGVTARHQSLSVMLDWSYERLSELERAILRQLAIFRGRFTLDAALDLVTAIAADASPSRDRLFGAMIDLADKSLLITEASGDTVCFRLLELTRTYAFEKLAGSGKGAVVAARHAERILALMGRAADAWPGAKTKREWLDTYGWAANDIRAALAWAFSPGGDPLLGASLTALVWPLAMHIHPFDGPEAIERAIQAVASVPNRPAEIDMRLHVGAAAFPLRRRGPETEAALAAALQLAEQSGDTRHEAEVLGCVTVAALDEGSYLPAAAHAGRLQAVARRSRDPLTLLVADRFGAQANHFAGDHAVARKLAERVLSHPTPRGPLGAAGMIDHRVSMRIVLSRILWIEGLADEATSLAERALEHAMTDSPSALCQVLSLAACPIALWRGDRPAAEVWIARLEAEFANHSLRGGWSPRAAAIPWRLALQAPAHESLPSRRAGIAAGSPANRLQLDHLITAHASFATPDAAQRAVDGDAGWCAPEIMRARGELLLHGGSPGAIAEAERWFQRSLAAARRQAAPGWELRAATSLAKLWRDLGRLSDARSLLEPVHRRFTEGFTTADLRAAASLLTALHSA